MLKYRMFNAIFIGVFFTTTLIYGLFNIVVDPFGMWSIVRVEGVNISKPEQQLHIRRFKAANVVFKKPTAVIIGSSRAECGLDPLTLKDISGENAYNSAVSGATIYEQCMYFKHALYVQPKLKKVVFGLDFFSFNENRQNAPDFRASRLSKANVDFKDFKDTVLSVEALKSSLETIKQNQSGSSKAEFTDGGMLNRKLSDKSSAELVKIDVESSMNSETVFLNYRLSQKGLDEFKSIIDLCRANDIEVKVFISPVHVAFLESIKVSGSWSKYEEWKREIAKITPYWDFSGCNSITTEPPEKIVNFFDSNHYKPKIGNLMLNKIYGINENSAHQDFGKYVTAETVDRHNDNIRNDVEKWERANAKWVETIQSLRKYK